MNKPTLVKDRSTEIIIACIGLAGVLFTGVVSNWDKMFGHVVTAEYSGYEPTGNFETELRYLMEVNGTRAMVSDMQQQMLQNILNNETAQYPQESEKLRRIVDIVKLNNETAQYPQESEKLRRIVDIVKKDAPTYEDTVHMMLPIYQKYFTVAEIQDLNRFYSTPTMQEMVRKLPAVTHEITPEMTTMMQNYMQKFLHDIASDKDLAKDKK